MAGIVLSPWMATDWHQPTPTQLVVDHRTSTTLRVLGWGMVAFGCLCFLQVVHDQVKDEANPGVAVGPAGVELPKQSPWVGIGVGLLVAVPGLIAATWRRTTVFDTAAQSLRKTQRFMWHVSRWSYAFSDLRRVVFRPYMPAKHGLTSDDDSDLYYDEVSLETSGGATIWLAILRGDRSRGRQLGKAVADFTSIPFVDQTS